MPVPFDKFKTLDKLDNVKCSILVIHGRTDGVINFWHGEELFAAAHEPKRSLWVDNADHVNVSLVARDEYELALKNFASELQTLVRIR